MARIAENSSSLAADLVSCVERLVAAARQQGREEALAEVRALVGGGRPTVVEVTSVRTKPGPRGRARVAAPIAAPTTRRKSSKSRKNPWTDMTTEARLRRVNAIRVGRGLPPRSSL